MENVKSDQKPWVRHVKHVSFAATMWTLSIAPTHAQMHPNSVQMGLAAVKFNAKSNDLTGPIGTTPPGIRIGINDASVLALVYDRRLDGPWSITLQGGMPPELKLKAAGSAAALGEIGSTRAWFPAVMGTYTWDAGNALSLHAGAGLHYTFFTDGKANAVYNGAFGGSASKVALSSSVGPVAKLGATWSLSPEWFLDLSYSKYWIDTTATVTTATKGLGDIERKIKIKTNPNLVSLTVGYRF